MIGWNDLRAQEVRFQGTTVQLATPETLCLMKKGTLRPIDQADVLNLREKFKLEE